MPGVERWVEEICMEVGTARTTAASWFPIYALEGGEFVKHGRVARFMRPGLATGMNGGDRELDQLFRHCSMGHRAQREWKRRGSKINMIDGWRLAVDG